MNETQLVDCFYRQGELSHIKAGDVLGEDFVFDEHGHEISTREELHEHVQEGGVLERRVKFD